MIRLFFACAFCLALAPSAHAFDDNFARAADAFAGTTKTYEEAEALQAMAASAAWSGDPLGEVAAVLLRGEEARRRSQYVTLMATEIAKGDLGNVDAHSRSWLMKEAFKVAKASMDLAEPGDVQGLIASLVALDREIKAAGDVPLENILASISDADLVAVAQLRALAEPLLAGRKPAPQAPVDRVEKIARKWGQLPGGHPLAKKAIVEHLIWTRDGLDKISDAVDGLSRAIREGKVNTEEMDRLTRRVDEHFERPILGGAHDAGGEHFDMLGLILDLCQREELAAICGKSFTDVGKRLTSGACAPLQCDCGGIRAGLLTGEWIRQCSANQLAAQRACLEAGKIVLGCGHPTGPGAMSTP